MGEERLLAGGGSIDRGGDVQVRESCPFSSFMAAAWKGVRGKIPFIMEVRDLWPAIFVELGVLRNQHLIAMLEKWEMALYRQCAGSSTGRQQVYRRVVAGVL